MNYKKIVYCLTGLFLLAGLYKLYKAVSHRLTAAPITYTFDEPVIGIYDRSKPGTASTAPLNFQHISFILDKSFDEDELAGLTIPADKPTLVTILMPERSFFSNHNLKQISEGDYDATISRLCKALLKKNSSLYIRLDPEMEVPVQMVSWQNQSSLEYINAFQHFSTVCKTVDPRIQLVWGPAGYPGADEYWPGSKAVDAISITLDSQSELRSTAYPHTDDVVTQLKRKIHRMRFMDKPILMLAPAKSQAIAMSATLPGKAIQEIDLEKKYIYSAIHTDLPPNQTPVRPTTIPILGVYDPDKTLLNCPPVSVEHIFTSLGDIEDGTFAKSFHEIIDRHHQAIVTVEPWKDKKQVQPGRVLQNTLEGAYDTQFRELYRLLSSVDETVYLRFAHEMEIPIHRYPWQSQDPVLYTKAFRYFMNFPDHKPDNIKRVWGPAGDRGSMEWWPGDDVVDYISMAIYGLPDKNITDPKKQESFSIIFDRKYHRMRFADKPVFVTEFGVKGPEDFQQQWLNDAAKFISKQKQIVGVCYFNLVDNPEVWGKMPPPDWSINKTTFMNFVSELKQ